jgi:hypothetical protein
MLGTGLCARVCSYLGHSKILRIRVTLFLGGTGDNQIGYHRISYMTAPRDLVNSELISECPVISSPTMSMVASGSPPALWSNIGVGALGH